MKRRCPPTASRVALRRPSGEPSREISRFGISDHAGVRGHAADEFSEGGRAPQGNVQSGPPHGALSSSRWRKISRRPEASRRTQSIRVITAFGCAPARARRCHAPCCSNGFLLSRRIRGEGDHEYTIRGVLQRVRPARSTRSEDSRAMMIATNSPRSLPRPHGICKHACSGIFGSAPIGQ